MCDLYIAHNAFPAECKTANGVPLTKTKDHNSLNDYRSISLLSLLSTHLERLMFINIIVTYLEELNIFHSFQSVVYSNHSCNTALSRLTDSSLTAVNRSDLSGDVLLDLKQAFDLVNHRVLISKLCVYLNNSDSLSFYNHTLRI